MASFGSFVAYGMTRIGSTSSYMRRAVELLVVTSGFDGCTAPVSSVRRSAQPENGGDGIVKYMKVAPPHPSNKSFEWQPALNERRLVSGEQAAQWDEEGYFLLEDAIDTARLDEVRR